MAIEKKSLISTLKTTKKANVAKEDLSHSGVSSVSVKSPAKVLATRGPKALATKGPKALATKGPKALATKGPKALATRDPKMLGVRTL